MNVSVVAGRLTRPAELRDLPGGGSVLTLDLSVGTPDAGSEAVPVSWFDAPAWARQLDVDETVVVLGRVRRRFFRKGGGVGSYTDVVAQAVVKQSRAKAVSGLVDRAIAALDDLAPSR